MHRVHWSVDLLDAWIVEAMLRAHGLDAHALDVNIVRQNWFEALAYGGYRVVVPDAQAARARDVLDDFGRGALAVPDERADEPPCPHCGGAANHPDPQPRRAVFGVMIGMNIASSFLMLAEPAMMFTAMLTVCAPIVLSTWLGSRHRCADCGTTFALPRLPFAALARANDDAQAMTTGEAI